MSRTCIRERLEATLEKVRWQRLKVRRIHLREEDSAALSRLMTKEFGKPFIIHAHGYREHVISPTAGKSYIDTEHGEQFIIPRQLSRRVGESPA